MSELANALVLLLVLLVASLSWIFLRSFKGPSAPVPPGSLGMPFIGETIQFLRAITSSKPWEFYEEREKRYGPVFKTSIFGRPTVVVRAAKGAKFLFSNHNTLVVSAWPSSLKPIMGEHSMFFMEEAKAKSFRNIIMAFLGPDALQRYVERASRTIEEHVESFWGVESSDEVKAYPLIKQALISLVFELFLGLEVKNTKEELMKHFTDLLRGVRGLPVNFPGTTFHKAMTARKKIMHILDHLIEQRRARPASEENSQHDLLSVLMTTRGEDGEFMSDEAIKDNLLMMVLSGHDTSASSITVALKFIAENPWCYDELRTEHLDILASKPAGKPLTWKDMRQMKCTWSVIQESMRLVPIAAGSVRKAVRDFEMDGFTIPKGWMLIWSMFRSNTNAEFFEEPNKFDPKRFQEGKIIPYSYTPFGGGPRICPGSELVRMQDIVFLHHLVARFKWSLVDPNERLARTPTVEPVNGLLLRLTKNPALGTTVET